MFSHRAYGLLVAGSKSYYVKWNCFFVFKSKHDHNPIFLLFFILVFIIISYLNPIFNTRGAIQMLHNIFLFIDLKT